MQLSGLQKKVCLHSLTADTTGLRLVGEQGPELEATGPARYFSASKTANMLKPSPDVFGSSAEYEYEQAVIANQRVTKKDKTDEQILENLESQLKLQKKVLDDQLRVTKVQHEEIC